MRLINVKTMDLVARVSALISCIAVISVTAFSDSEAAISELGLMAILAFGMLLPVISLLGAAGGALVYLIFRLVICAPILSLREY